MPALSSLLKPGRKPLWLDYTDYAAQLLNSGIAPWLDVAACVAWQRKAQGLLKSDVLTLPLDRVCAAWLDVHPALREAMASKRRTVFALKTLLADEGLRAQLVELARGLRACFATVPLALLCPTPRRWVAEAYAQAHGDAAVPDVSEDDADSAALYLADFLRCFGDVGIDLLLLQEAPDAPALDAAQLALYQPALNLAAHYRWEAGLALAQAPAPAALPGLALVIASAAVPGCVNGTPVPTGFWDGAAAPDCPAGGLRYAQIPARAQPESVLQKLQELR
jgi:hypothetical protein